MSDLEDRLGSLESRLAAREAEIERRLADRFGTAAPSRHPAAPPSGGAPKRLASCTRYGLFVGINEYSVYPDGQQPRKLYGCVADARNVSDACRELGDWHESNCRVLTDREATRGAVRAALADLAGKAGAGDVVLYFHSSHGGSDPNAPQDNNTWLCMNDGPYFEKEIWSDLARFREGVKLVCIVDACHSGGFIGKGCAGPELPPPDALPRRIGERFKSAWRRENGVRIEDIGWITAAAGAQYSLDAGSIGGQFATRTLVNEGWRAGAADGYTDAIVSTGGEPAVQSAQSATALPAMAVPQPCGHATFLDLALYACRTWKDRISQDPQEGIMQHIPQFFNPGLLHSVVAGRTGV